MTRAEIEDAVAAGVISAAVLDSLAKQPEVHARISA
jgi:F0F1-type ATP synthase membrane subunit c/vacuolar-type H+-ATPase subunit K